MHSEKFVHEYNAITLWVTHVRRCAAICGSANNTNTCLIRAYMSLVWVHYKFSVWTLQACDKELTWCSLVRHLCELILKSYCTETARYFYFCQADIFLLPLLLLVFPSGTLEHCLSVAPHFTLVKEALIEIGCVVTSLVVGWLVGWLVGCHARALWPNGAF